MLIDKISTFTNWDVALIPLFVIPIIAWEAVWKGIALWKAAKNNQLYWFIAIFILNTAGILPIIYLIASRRREEQYGTTKSTESDMDGHN